MHALRQAFARLHRTQPSSLQESRSTGLCALRLGSEARRCERDKLTAPPNKRLTHSQDTVSRPCCSLETPQWCSAKSSTRQCTERTQPPCRASMGVQRSTVQHTVTVQFYRHSSFTVMYRRYVNFPSAACRFLPAPCIGLTCYYFCITSCIWCIHSMLRSCHLLAHVVTEPGKGADNGLLRAQFQTLRALPR